MCLVTCVDHAHTRDQANNEPTSIRTERKSGDRLLSSLKLDAGLRLETVPNSERAVKACSNKELCFVDLQPLNRQHNVRVLKNHQWMNFFAQLGVVKLPENNLLVETCAQKLRAAAVP